MPTAPLSLGGIKINLAAEAKPLIDQTVNKQVAELQERVRNDPAIERVAREQWTQLCRTLPLGGGDTGLPPLYLEMRPVRAAAAQPQIDANNLTLTIGVQAETRIVATATKPTCPFPAALDLVPTLERGKLNVVVPIDMPFKTLSPLLEAQLKGRVFPDDKTAPVEASSQREPRRRRRPAADLAAGEGQGAQELVRLRRRCRRQHLGQAGARSEDAGAAADRPDAGGGDRRRPSACSARRRALPFPICRRRWPNTRRSISSPSSPTPRRRSMRR